MTQNKELFSSEVERRDMIEYGFEFNDTPESTAAASGGQVQVTSGDATITGVGTTFDDDYDVGDLIKITRTDSSTDYFKSKNVMNESLIILNVGYALTFIALAIREVLWLRITLTAAQISLFTYHYFYG